MKVLTVYAHHDPRSFCHGVLERFTAGLTEAGHQVPARGRGDDPVCFTVGYVLTRLPGVSKVL